MEYTSEQFQTQLAHGQVGESVIARWLRSRGHNVMPVYEKEIDTGKGPQVFTPDGSLIAPDMFVFKTGDAYWVEAKHKTAFTWHRKTGRWVTGIDLKHYKHYCSIEDLCNWPVYLMFLQRGGRAKDTPDEKKESPAGLFCGSLAHLREHENHRHMNWGRSGMVYWAHSTLTRVATLEELGIAPAGRQIKEQAAAYAA